MTDLFRFEGSLFHYATDLKDKIYALLSLMEVNITPSIQCSANISEVSCGVCVILMKNAELE